ncbi:hypothetical protein Tco_0445419 [Tanacetum coccineum]
MDDSKRGHISMQERLDLNKTQGASTPKEVKRMQNVPNALVWVPLSASEAEMEAPHFILPMNREFRKAPDTTIGRYHYVRKCIALHEIRFLKVHKDDNLADPLTKVDLNGRLTAHVGAWDFVLASSFHVDCV